MVAGACVAGSLPELLSSDLASSTLTVSDPVLTVSKSALAVSASTISTDSFSAVSASVIVALVSMFAVWELSVFLSAQPLTINAIPATRTTVTNVVAITFSSS